MWSLSPFEGILKHLHEIGGSKPYIVQITKKCEEIYNSLIRKKHSQDATHSSSVRVRLPYPELSFESELSNGLGFMLERFLKTILDHQRSPLS